MRREDWTDWAALVVLVVIALGILCGVRSCQQNRCHAAGGQLAGGRDPLCVDPSGRIITDW